jgi:hypothetical protein
MDFSQGTGRVAKGGQGSGRHAENLTTWEVSRLASGEEPSVPSVLADHSAVILQNAHDNIGLEDQTPAEIRAEASDMAREHNEILKAHATEAENSFAPSRNFDYTGEMFPTDAGKAHYAAASAHLDAVDAWNEVARLANPSDSEMMKAFAASEDAALASRIARYVSEHPEGNTFPHYVEDSMVTKGGVGSGIRGHITQALSHLRQSDPARWSSATSGSRWEERGERKASVAAQPARKVADLANSKRDLTESKTAGEMSDRHAELARYHDLTAQAHRDRGETEAAKAHEIAADLHNDAMTAYGEKDTRQEPLDRYYGDATHGDLKSMSETAAKASEAADKASTNVGGIPNLKWVTKGGPGSGRTATVTRMTDVAEEDLTPAERKEFFRTGSPEYHTGPRSFYYRGNPTLPDGMVNPRTLEVGTGKNEPYGFSPAEQHIVVQGYRPGGTIFTRVIERQSSDEKIGDIVSFQHDQTGKFLGKGTIVGITDPDTGKAYGTFPDKKLSHHVYK